eukprot:5035978-Prymnesium_polylepis.1
MSSLSEALFESPAAPAPTVAMGVTADIPDAATDWDDWDAEGDSDCVDASRSVAHFEPSTASGTLQLESGVLWIAAIELEESGQQG